MKRGNCQVMVLVSAIVCFSGAAWSLEKGDVLHAKATLTGHTREVRWVELSPDGKTVVSSDGSQLKFWECPSGKPIATSRSVPFCLSAPLFSPDGSILALSGIEEPLIPNPLKDESIGLITLWDPRNWKCKATLRIADGGTVFAFARDSKTLISGGGFRSTTIILWDLVTAKERRIIENRTAHIRALAVSADGKTLAAASNDGYVVCWDIETLKESASWEAFPNSVIASIAFSADGRTLVAAINDVKFGRERQPEPTLKFYDIAAGKERPALVTPKTRNGYTDPVRCVRFSADGKMLAIAGDSSVVRIFEPVSGKLLALLPAKSIGYLAFSPDTKWLIGAGEQNVSIWQLPEAR